MQYMKPAFRNAAFYCHAFSRSLTLNSNPLHLVSPFGRPQTFRLAPPVSCFSSLMASSLEKLFDDFRVQFEESGTLREWIRSVVSEIESSTRLIYVTLLLVHQSSLAPLPVQPTTLCSSSSLNPNHTNFLFLTFFLDRFWVSLSCTCGVQMGLFVKDWVLSRKHQNPNLCSAFLGLDDFVIHWIPAMNVEGVKCMMWQGKVFSHYLLYLVFWVWTTELLEKAKSQVNVLKKQYKQLAEVVGGYPGQYYRWLSSEDLFIF